MQWSDRTSSTPAVVPGAAPALAKAGVGGYQSLYPNDTTIFVAQIPFAMVKILGAKLACQGLKVMYHRQHRQLGPFFFQKNVEVN